MDKMIIKENISFERGLDPKSTLGIGRKAFSKTEKGLKKMFDDDLKDKGFYPTTINTRAGEIASISYFLKTKDFIKLFNGDKREMVKFLAGWLTKNTNFYLHDLTASHLAYGHKDEKRMWTLVLNTWEDNK